LGRRLKMVNGTVGTCDASWISKQSQSVSFFLAFLSSTMVVWADDRNIRSRIKYRFVEYERVHWDFFTLHCWVHKRIDKDGDGVKMRSNVRKLKLYDFNFTTITSDCFLYSTSFLFILFYTYIIYTITVWW
jgi:hypothetical protein